MCTPSYGTRGSCDESTVFCASAGLQLSRLERLKTWAKLVSPFDWLAWTNARHAGLLEARSCCELVKATYILNISVLTTKALTSRVWKGSSLSEVAGPRPRLVGEVTWGRSGGGRRAHRRGRKCVREAGRTEARQAWCTGRGRPRRRRRWGSGWPSGRGGVGWSAAPVWRSSSGMKRTRRRTCRSPGEKQNGLPFEITTALLAIGLTRSDTLHCVTCPIWSGLEPRGGTTGTIQTGTHIQSACLWKLNIPLFFVWQRKRMRDDGCCVIINLQALATEVLNKFIRASQLHIKILVGQISSFLFFTNFQKVKFAILFLFFTFFCYKPVSKTFMTACFYGRCSNKLVIHFSCPNFLLLPHFTSITWKMAATDASKAWTVSQQMLLILLSFLLTWVTVSSHDCRNVTVNRSCEVWFSRPVSLSASYDSKIDR